MSNLSFYVVKYRSRIFNTTYLCNRIYKTICFNNVSHIIGFALHLHMDKFRLQCVLFCLVNIYGYLSVDTKICLAEVRLTGMSRD